MNVGFQVGAVGVSIKLFVKRRNGSPVNISSATIKTIRLNSDGGVSIDYPASFLTDGSDGVLVYVTTGNELSMPGKWKAQAYVSMPGFAGYTTTTEFMVSSNLPTS